MCMTFEQAASYLDDIADGIPDSFYNKLNGGIIIEPFEKRHPEPLNHLLIMGEYKHSRLNRQIIIYYGSFMLVYENADESTWKKELRGVLLHEFTHHVESIAGERALIRKDREQMQEFIREMSKISARAR